MSSISGRPLQRHLEAADSWSADVGQALRRSRRTAWLVAAAAASLALVEGLSLLALVPLKTVVPYAFVVDRRSGFIELAQPLQPGPLSQDVAVTQSYLAQYVLARETFDAADLKENYRKVLLWSQGPARTAYGRDLSRDNPASPLRLYRRDTTVRVTVKSISLISRTAALVRFDAERRDGGGAPQLRAYASVIGFRYSGAPLRMEDRLSNPLGFQVMSYRRDAEAAPAVEPGP